MRYAVVEQDPETKKYITRVITKPGPPNLLSTGVRGLKCQNDDPLPDDVAQ